MEIIQNLNEVAEFVFVDTLFNVFSGKFGVVARNNPDEAFLTFLKTSILILEKNKHESKDQFFEKIKSFLNKKSKSKTTIHQVVQKHISQASGDLVEIKGICQTNPQFTDFNITSKILVSRNFEILLQEIGESALLEVFQNSIILFKKDDIFVQVIGRSLQGYFEKQKNTKSTGNNRKFKTDGNGKQILEQELDRNVFLYCLHKNKNPDFFHKSIFYTLKQKIKANHETKKEKNCTKKPLYIIKDEDVQELYKEIFADEKMDKMTKECINGILKKIIKKYLKIDIMKLLFKHCPMDSQVFQNARKTLKDMKKKIEKNKENVDLSEALHLTFTKTFTSLTEMTINPNDVIHFLKVVFKNLFPSELYGDVNIPVFISYIKKVVNMKRFETFTFDEVYKKMQTSSFPWFKRKFDQLHKKEILGSKLNISAKILKFVFQTLTYLIKANFYVTEKHNQHNKLFYYSKSVWLLMAQFGTLQLELTNLKKIEEKIDCKNNQIIERPIGKLRFVPKGDSLRPIMTFHKRFRDSKQNKLVRIATYLNPIKTVLRSVKYSLSEKCGYSVFDNHQIFSRLETFVEKWKKKGKPELFCVSMDISKCYDSVDLEKMFEFIKNENTFKEMYFLNNFFKIIRNKRFCFKKQKNPEKKEITSLFYGKRRDGSNELMDLLDLKEYFKDKIVHSNKTIFIDSGVKYLISKDEILEKLKFICDKVYVKFGKSHFQLKRGLPQGLSVSGVLSSFYYSMLEDASTKKLVSDIQKRNELIMIMRLTDDYLIVADNQANAMSVVNALIACSKNHGFEFNKKKFKANFDMENGLTQDWKNSEFRWIGKTFSFPKFEVEHTQILNKKEAFYTVVTNFPTGLKGLSDFLKGKFKTFFLNQNTFYFNKIVNSDEKMKKIIPRVTESSYYKLNAYLVHLSALLNKKIYFRESKIIASKLIETIVDCSYLLASLSTNLSTMNIAKSIVSHIIRLLKNDRITKFKDHLYRALEEQLKNMSEDHYVFIK